MFRLFSVACGNVQLFVLFWLSDYVAFLPIYCTTTSGLTHYAVTGSFLSPHPLAQPIQLSFNVLGFLYQARHTFVFAHPYNLRCLRRLPFLRTQLAHSLTHDGRPRRAFPRKLRRELVLDASAHSHTVVPEARVDLHRGCAGARVVERVLTGRNAAAADEGDRGREMCAESA